MNYLYDNTFEGFLCCIYAHYYDEKADGVFPVSTYQEDMLISRCIIDTDEKKAGIVYEAIENKISKYDIKRVYTVFCSSIPGKETMLLRYISLGFHEGSKVGLLYGNPVVFNVLQIEKKVVSEIHRMCGLIRFSEMTRADAQNSRSILYAPMEPDHDITEFLAPHFCDRYKEDPFIIHDKRRNKALFAAAGEWYITDFSAGDVLMETDPETQYRKLWKEYFETVAIKERTNPKCQRRFMPARYWRNLTECC
ncbi:MAG: TIGR03915 family putative DNA repair protein [Clostridiales Family XIII bacterium]|jgi:probable DNA metabolism protein|nr:TIGR03915 family putative DNA repair protein [Clostridiales Family XIII bacterium]